MSTIHISVGGPDRKITDAEGKVWPFEDHPRFGPIVLDRRGGPAPKQPGERCAFWHAWKVWRDQGKRLAGDVCVWDAPAPCVVEHMGGRHFRVISGDPDAGGGVQRINTRREKAAQVSGSSVPSDGQPNDLAGDEWCRHYSGSAA